MRRLIHTTATASGLIAGLVAIIIAIVGLQFVAVRAYSPTLLFRPALSFALGFLRMVLAPLVLAYIAGIIGWGIVFGIRHSGSDRLAAMQTWRGEQ